MDEKYLEIDSHFTEDEQRILRGYWKEHYEYKYIKTAVCEMEERHKEGAQKLLEFKENAEDRIEALENDPECSFCNTSSSHVEKMFQKNEYLNICSNCITKLFSELRNDK